MGKVFECLSFECLGLVCLGFGRLSGSAQTFRRLKHSNTQTLKHSHLLAVIVLVLASNSLWGSPYVSKEEYLDLMEAAVSAYSDEHIARYIETVERDGVQEHGFPRLAANLGILLANGRISGKRELVRQMMAIGCREAAKGPMKLEGNEFSVKELTLALAAIEKAGLFEKSVTDGWRADLKGVEPYRCYRCKPKVGANRANNWCVFGCASEQARLAFGAGGDAAFVEKYVSDQLRWFDANGMYRDPFQPAVYDLVTRLQFMAILDFGYDGPSRATLEELLDRAAEPTLAMLSAAGEIPYGGRSNQFLHNHTFYAAVCEWYAARYHARGDEVNAARFRMAARCAVDALKEWLAVRPMRHVKNLYPRVEGVRKPGVGCEEYAYFDKYMVTMGSWAMFAWRFSDESVPDVSTLTKGREGRSQTLVASDHAPMAFATTPDFHFVFLRAGGYSAQFDYNADTHYDCDGLGRLQRRGAPAALCISTPCAANPNYRTELQNARALSIAPVGGGTLMPAGSGRDLDGAWANWRQGALDWRCRLTKDGLVSELHGDGVVALSLPAFAFDGERETEIACAGNVLTIRYRGWRCVYVADGKIADTGAVCCNRNGRYRAFEARGRNRLVVKVSIEKEASSVCLCGVAPERADDFFWENDRVGFRAYGPGDFHKWSGIDMFNKATKENYVVRLLRERGRHGNWHKNQNGKCFDNYTVGAGRGVGAVALWGDGEWKTYPNWDRCDVVTNSDDFCAFKLEYPAFSSLGRMTYHITFRRGEPFFRNEVSFELSERMREDFVLGPGLDVAAGRGHGGDLVEDAAAGVISLFETAKEGHEGSTMTAIFLEDPTGCAIRSDHLGCKVLSLRRPTFAYWAGALWDGEGAVTTAAAWHAFVKDFRDKKKERK